MSKLSCYIDGSQVKESNTIRQGWGILAFHAHGETVEMNGVVEHASTAQKAGWYETLAFYNAVKYAMSHGYSPADVSFYTDCSWVAYSGFHLVPENYSGRRLAVTERLQMFKKFFYPQDETLVETMSHWLVNSQMHWLKGHKLDVNNNRVDYLARSAVYCKQASECMEFTEWLSNGLSVWDHELKQSAQYLPPFVGSVQ